MWGSGQRDIAPIRPVTPHRFVYLPLMNSVVTLMGGEDDRFEQVALHPPTIHPAFAASDARPRIEKEDVELLAAYARAADSITFTGGSASTDLCRSSVRLAKRDSWVQAPGSTRNSQSHRREGFSSRS